MKLPLVSVIIPCFNAEKYVFIAVSSILNQSYKNLEVILIDDGSSDNTKGIIEQLQNEDSRIKIYYNEQNLGLIKSLNKAIAKANGKFIARMDADDFSKVSRLEKQVDSFIKDPSLDILGTKASPIDMDGKKSRSNSYTYLHPETLKLSALLTQPFFHGSIMIKASILKENNYSEGYKHSEDFELWNRLSAKNYKLANLSETLYVYRINDEGVSRKFEAIQIESHNLISKHYLELLLNEEIDLDIVAILNNRPIGNIKLKQVKEATEYFDLIVKKTNSKKQINSYELLEYSSRQILDILIQCFINSKSILAKTYCVQKIIFKLRDKTARNYLRQKIKYFF